MLIILYQKQSEKKAERLKGKRKRLLGDILQSVAVNSSNVMRLVARSNLYAASSRFSGSAFKMSGRGATNSSGVGACREL